MQKTIKKIMSIIILLVFGIYLLPNSFNVNNIFISNVLADDKAEPGDKVDVPSSYPQHAIYEASYSSISWIYTQRDVYDKWVEQGRKTADDGTGLCYITAGGIDWALVAVAPTFGEAGDYLKVHVKDKEGKEKDYYMIVCDTKNPTDSTAYYINVGGKDVHYGHSSNCSGWIGHCKVAHGHPATGIHLNILEFVWNWSTDCTKLCQLYTDVQYIINGGNYFENPDGPIGFTIGPDETNESNTFAGACGTFFRQIWDGLATFMDNTFNGKNKATSLYSLNTTRLASNQFYWPSYTTIITSPYGTRIHPVTGVRKFHAGVDIGAAHSTEIWAAGSGNVILAGPSGGYGNCVMIQHDNGLITLYGHQSKVNVKEGDRVNARDLIGWVGSTGVSTGPHIHFEIRDTETGETVDPLTFTYTFDPIVTNTEFQLI